jgi:hypothetical protein
MTRWQATNKLLFDSRYAPNTVFSSRFFNEHGKEKAFTNFQVTKFAELILNLDHWQISFEVLLLRISIAPIERSNPAVMVDPFNRFC